MRGRYASRLGFPVHEPVDNRNSAVLRNGERRGPGRRGRAGGRNRGTEAGGGIEAFEMVQDSVDAED